jgi:hypothetical protein
MDKSTQNMAEEKGVAIANYSKDFDAKEKPPLSAVPIMNRYAPKTPHKCRRESKANLQTISLLSQ